MEVRIIERYADYSPPASLARIVRDLLRCVPPAYLAGLHAVVLTNQSAMSRDDRRRTTYHRKRKVPLTECLGFYQPGEEPYIQLHVDQLMAQDQKRRIGSLRKRLWRLLATPWTLRMRIGHTLYHELGHHVHLTLRPENGHRETIAENYKWELLMRIMKRRWYLALLANLSLLLVPELLIKMVKGARTALAQSAK